MKFDKYTIRKRALELIAHGEPRVAAHLSGEFGLSRQSANGYLQALTQEGLIEAHGTTRARTYRLRDLVTSARTYPCPGLEEDIVWRDFISPLLSAQPENLRNIWGYAASEIINNAIEHSGSPEVHVSVRSNALYTEIVVSDQGEGIFLKIQRELGLHDPRESILELAKGKLTTAPANHSGEGIFFTSRSMDRFEIESHTLRFTHAANFSDAIVEHAMDVSGTLVRMQLDNDNSRTLKSVFDAFADADHYAFDKTVVPLRLAQYEGEKLVSRSQARRIVHRFERFKRVELDFGGIAEIGQAFADELFRVFANANPGIDIVPVHMEPAVEQMVRRAQTAAGAGTPKPGSAPTAWETPWESPATSDVAKRWNR